MKHRSSLAAAGKKFRTKNISRRVRQIVISPIKEMSILADLEEGKRGPKIISFGQGIPYLDTPSHIKIGARNALNKISTAKYTLEPGITELRNLVAEFLKKEKGIKNVKPKKETMITVEQTMATVFLLGITLIIRLKIDGLISPTVKATIDDSNVNKNM